MRILEFERDVKRNRRNTNLQVELWDCSGDKKYENCWVAILREVAGVVLVYDPSIKEQEKEIQMWYKVRVAVRVHRCTLLHQALSSPQAYIQPLGLSSSQILVLAHQHDATTFRKYQAPQALSSFGFACTTLESDDGLDAMRKGFSTLLEGVAGAVADKSKADLEGALKSMSG